MDKISVAEARKAEAVGKQVRLQGWVRTRRDSKGGFSFIELNDGSCFGNVQIVAEAALPNYEAEIKKLNVGCSVTIDGEVLKSPAKGQATEVKASSVLVHGWCDADAYPIQKKGASFEYLRTVAHLRPRTNTFGAVTRLRNCVSNSIHQFFQEQGFLYIHAPIITASDCEGAGELFKVTTVDPAKPPLLDGKIDYTQDFFGKPSFLTVSGQLQAEMFACGLGKVYTCGPTFRAENSNTTRHLAEFWMIEPEMAFFDLEDNMNLAEEFIKYIIRFVMDNNLDDLEFLAQRLAEEEKQKPQHERGEMGLIEKLGFVANNEFERLSYTEAIDILKESSHNKKKKFQYHIDVWGVDLQSEHERYLVEKHFKK